MALERAPSVSFPEKYGGSDVQIETITYKDHKLVGRLTGAGWQFTIAGTGRKTGVHRDMNAALLEARQIVDAALAHWATR